MEWLNHISNNDNILIGIEIQNDYIKVKVQLWNGLKKEIAFLNCVGFKVKNAIGREIGDILLKTQTPLLEETSADIIANGGSVEELPKTASLRVGGNQTARRL